MVGLKDSSGDMGYFHQLLAAFEGRSFALLMGHEWLFGESLLFGARGGVPGGANVVPQWFVELYEAGLRGDLVALREAQKKILLFSELYRVGQYRSAGIKGIKGALSLLGLCRAILAEPFQSFEEPELEKIKDILARLGLIQRPRVKESVRT